MEDTRILERPIEQHTAGTVAAAALRCLLGAIGAAILVGVLCWRFGAGWETIAQWALFAGGVTLGGLLLATMAIDKIVDLADYQRLLSDLEATHNDNADLRDTVASLQRDLIAANAYLTVSDHKGTRQILRNTPSAQATPEVRDAIELIRRHFADGRWPAKDRMNTLLGWPSPRWFAARDVLLAHGIVASQGRSTAVLVASLAEALAKLEGPKS